MLLLNTGAQPRHVLPADGHAHATDIPRHVVWIDLYSPTEEERGAVERATGLRVPAKAELSEIESSSRLSVRNGVLTLSTPMVSRVEGAAPIVAPLGFVLTRDRLLTVRYTELRAFDAYACRFAEGSDKPHNGVSAFVGLLEAIVDRLADVLERVGGDLDGISRCVFRPEMTEAASNPRTDATLRDTLRAIGRGGDLISSIRDSLLGLRRMVGFVMEMAAEWIPADLGHRVKTIRRDLASLADYANQLTNKVQFLLDATLGFISIQQNNGIKILTVASIVGIPPTLIASMYGMNFKLMPELDWRFGYPYALTLIVLSAVLPLLWFRRRGWI